jgi:aminoacrylate hydrolase
MPSARVNAIDVYYEDLGAGVPVVLVTGLGGVGAGWGPQIPKFAREYRTIVPDHRGTGQSTAAATGYTIDEHARDVAELLRALHAAPAHVVGWSTGGAIALAMAVDHPDTVRSLTLTATWGRTDPYFARLFEHRQHVLTHLGQRAFAEQTTLLLYSPAYLRAHWSDLQPLERRMEANAPSQAIQLARIDMVIANDLLDRLDGIDVPTAIVAGELDVVTPPYFSEELARHLPHAELHTIPDSGHSVFVERPEEFFAIVQRFLQAQDHFAAG